MSDYIKELNIVDFLGVIVPGSVLVLLLAGDNASALLLWTSYFGAEATPIVRGIFLLIAGYLAGMVLHEIGDLAEKGVWCFTGLDPKAYAINAVGIDDIDKATEKAQLNTNVSANQRCVFSSRTRGMWGCILAVVILVSCTLGFSQAMKTALEPTKSAQVTANIASNTNTDTPQATIITTAPADSSEPTLSITAPTQPDSSDNLLTDAPKCTFGWSYIVSFAAFTALLLTILLLAYWLYTNNDGKNATKEQRKGNTGQQNDVDASSGATTSTTNAPNNWETLKRLCLQNPQIQTYVSQKGAPSKMSMFDSFRHVMRNLLIAVAIVNVFSCWHPIDLYRDVAAYFAKSGNMPLDFAVLTFWFCFVILFAFSRYSHFVYLRYKYSYEAFVSKVNVDNEPEVSHHHLVIEHGPIPPNTP